MQTAAPEREMIAGLAKGLAVIRAFGAGGPLCTLAEIARLAQLTPPAARRCLHTLEALGYVGRDGRRFFLRPRVLELATAYLEGIKNDELANDYLQAIVQASGQSSSLAVLDGQDVVYVARVGVRRVVRLEASIGTRYPAFATSLGRVLLSDRSDEELDAFLAQADLKALTKATVTDRAALKDKIRQAARDGYSMVEDELATGILALAVPVIDRMGRVVAAINCSAHSGDTSQAELMAYLPVLQETASRLSRALPHFPALTVVS
jgi:IclR family pca regulon transcriptional regulator